MKTARDPEAVGSHPYHDTRLIVSDCWNPEEGRGHWLARMSDCEGQPRLAHMFAAAPDLLAALKRLVREIRPFASDNGPREDALDEALAAIAKAEGR